MDAAVLDERSKACDLQQSDADKIPPKGADVVLQESKAGKASTTALCSGSPIGKSEVQADNVGQSCCHDESKPLEQPTSVGNEADATLRKSVSIDLIRMSFTCDGDPMNQNRGDFAPVGSFHTIVMDRLSDGGCIGDVWDYIGATAKEQLYNPTRFTVSEGMQKHQEERVCQMESSGSVTSVAIMPMKYAGLALVCFMVLISPGFLLGFLGGCMPPDGPIRCVVQPFFTSIPLFGCGAWSVAFESKLVKWSLILWCCWGFLFFAPMNLLVRVATNFRFEKLRLLYTLVWLGLAGTMPLPVAAAKIYGYRKSNWKRVIKILIIKVVKVFNAILLSGFIVVDKMYISSSRLPLVRALRPLILFAVRRSIYLVWAQALSRHPSPTYRSTYLVFLHLSLATLTAGAASRCEAWSDLFYFVAIDAAMDSIKLFFFLIGGTPLINKFRTLQIMKIIWDIGKPAPLPGMVKLQFRGLELIIASVSVTTILLGMTFSYLCFLQWFESYEALEIPLRFWFPKKIVSIRFLCVLLAKEFVFDLFVLKLVARKAGTRYRGVFVSWLYRASPVGWLNLLLIAWAGSWLVDFLTMFSYDVEPLRELAQSGFKHQNVDLE